MRIILAILWSMVFIFLDSRETQNHGSTPFHKWRAVLPFIFALIDYKRRMKISAKGIRQA